MTARKRSSGSSAPASCARAGGDMRPRVSHTARRSRSGPRVRPDSTYSTVTSQRMVALTPQRQLTRVDRAPVRQPAPSNTRRAARGMRAPVAHAASSGAGHPWPGRPASGRRVRGTPDLPGPSPRTCQHPLQGGRGFPVRCPGRTPLGIDGRSQRGPRHRGCGRRCQQATSAYWRVVLKEDGARSSRRHRTLQEQGTDALCPKSGLEWEVSSTSAGGTT